MKFFCVLLDIFYIHILICINYATCVTITLLLMFFISAYLRTMCIITCVRHSILLAQSYLRVTCNSTCVIRVILLACYV